MITATARKAIEKAEAMIRAAIHETNPADHPRALSKMRAALEQTRKAWVLMLEGENALIDEGRDR